jgi:hypothetical protein
MTPCRLASLALAALLALASATRADIEIRGVNLAHLHRGDVGYGSDACRQQLDDLQSLGSNWVAINPFAYMGDINTPSLRFGGDRSMGLEGQKRTIADSHARGIKVMIKPHIWSGQFGREGKMPIDIAMTSEADWDAWFDQYGQYILAYAKFAQESGADALCIGCELQGTSKQTERWKKLIAEVRKVYTGYLTYAAAFEEWRQIEFWPELDVVGINAYWKLADSESASDDEIRAGWQRVFDDLEPFANRIGKGICFTELGYSTSTRAAMEPWSWTVEREDPQLQERLFRIALEETAKRPFIKGVFFWKWFTAANWQKFERRDAFAIQDTQAIRQILKEQWTKE